MGVGESFGEAFAKAQISAGQALPETGAVFISVNRRDRQEGLAVARKFSELGFTIYATRGTSSALQAAGIESLTAFKVNEGRPNVVDLIKGQKVNLILNTPAGAHSFNDEKIIRRAAMMQNIPCITTISGARAAAEGIAARRARVIQVYSLQQLHAEEMVG